VSVSAPAYFPRADGEEGFTASKWASERLLENAAQASPELEVCVHRPCAVTGAHAPNEDALNALIRYSCMIKCVPRFEQFEGFLDFQDVEKIADGIVREALGVVGDDKDGVGTGREAVRFVHHSSGVKVQMHEFGAWLAELYGRDFGEVSVEEWIEKATQAGIDPLIVGYLEAIVGKGEKIRFPFMGQKTA